MRRGQRVQAGVICPVALLAGIDGKGHRPLAVSVLRLAARGAKPRRGVARVGVVRAKPQGLVELGLGLVVLPHVGAAPPAGSMIGNGKFRIELQGRVIIGQGQVEVILVRAELTAHGMPACGAGIDRKGFAAIGKGLVLVAQGVVASGAVQVVVGAVVVFLIHRREPGDSPRQVALKNPLPAGSARSLGSLFRQSDGLGKIVKGLVVLLQPLPGETATLVGEGVFRFNAEGFIEIGNRLFVFVLVIPAFAPPAVAIAILRV